MSGLDATLFSGDPLLLPQLLALLGLGLALAASLRRRVWASPRRRVAVASYAVLAGAAFLVAGLSLAQRAPLFWGMRWEQGQRVLVLERLGPLGEVRIESRDVSSVTEFTTPERSLSGPRPSSSFIVRTRSGATYWSAPVYRRADADRARAALATRTARHERFLVGPSLP